MPEANIFIILRRVGCYNRFLSIALVLFGSNLNLIVLMVTMHGKRIYNVGCNPELRNNWAETATNQ
jgi:hypothetical protein